MVYMATCNVSEYRPQSFMVTHENLITFTAPNIFIIHTILIKTKRIVYNSLINKKYINE